MTSRLRIALLALAALAACDRIAAPASQSPLPAEPAKPSFVVAEPLAADGTTNLVITAPKDRPLWIGHCNGAFSWGLEHEVGDAWAPAWIPAINGCASAPIAIPEGTTQTLPVAFALAPGELLPAGRYRIALYALQRTPGAPGQVPEQVDPDERVSEPFDFDPATVRLPVP